MQIDSEKLKELLHEYLEETYLQEKKNYSANYAGSSVIEGCIGIIEIIERIEMELNNENT